MLVLTRKQSESIIINENITITVVKIGNGRVRIGIDAPKDIGISRSELLEDKEKEQWAQS